MVLCHHKPETLLNTTETVLKVSSEMPTWRRHKILLLLFISMVMGLSFGRQITPQTYLLENACCGAGREIPRPPIHNPASEVLGRRAASVAGGGRKGAGSQLAFCRVQAQSKVLCFAARNSDSFDFNFDVSIFLMTHLIISYGI